MIEFLVTGRGGGKTHAMLLWAKRLIDAGELDQRPVIAVHSDQEKERLRQMWVERYGDDPNKMPRFYTYTDVRAGVFSIYGSKLAIDNVENLLAEAIPYPIDFVTATGELR